MRARPTWAFMALQDYIFDLETRVDKAEAILTRARAPRRPDGTYNISREALEQAANDYFLAVAEPENRP